MKIIKSIRIVIHISDFKDCERTLIIIFIKANDLNNLVTLRTRRVLKTLTTLTALKALTELFLLASTLLELSNISSTIDKVTITPSNTLNVSRIYSLGPNPISLKIISMANRTVKTKLRVVN